MVMDSAIGDSGLSGSRHLTYSDIRFFEIIQLEQNLALKVLRPHMHYVAFAAIALVVAAIYKIASNIWYARKIRSYRAQQREYLQKYSKGIVDWEYEKKVPEIKSLVEKSGVPDQHMSWMEAIGLGHAEHRTISILENISAPRKEIQERFLTILFRAEGVFESRAREGFSAFYWIETIIRLPARILQYIGVPEGSVWLKIANVIAWVVTIVGSLLALPDFVDWQAMVSEKLAELLRTPLS